MVKKIRVKEIAKEVGCSPSTVSQAFNNPRLVNRKTRSAILEVCERIGYVRRKFKTRRKKIVGITGINHEMIMGDYYGPVYNAILSEAKKEGINVIIESFADNDDTLPNMFSKKVLDGLIVFGVISTEHILAIKQQNIPIVLCGRPISWVELHLVLSDGRAGIYEITKHLIGLGHKKIGYITGSDIFDPITSDRLDGFRYALKEQGISIPDEYIVVGSFAVAITPATHEVDQLIALKDPPTAIVCESDGLAYKAYHRLREKGFKIPKDISLTGFDNLSFPNYISQFKPKLTTVDVNLYELGKNTLNILLNMIETPASVACRHTLPVKLVVGETTAAPRKGSG